ncbi:MAG: RIP metalloprotease RseP [bacterium]
MMTILYILLLLFILGIIIFIHELGHFYFAKKYDVHIYEFSIGMGPVVYSKLGKDNIQYNLRAVPLGGFVAMAGEVYEDGTGEVKIKKEDYMCNKKWYQRFMILIAGVLNNFILAIILLFGIALFYGGSMTTSTIEYVAEESAAESAGMLAGDTITEINGKAITSWDSAQIILVMEDEDGIYDFVVDRDGEEILISVEPNLVDDAMVFGIGLETETYTGLMDSIKYAFVKFYSIIQSMFLTLYALFAGSIGVNALAGPIGMYDVVKTSVGLGLVNVVYLLAFLSINVGILNILPFPAFDGGRLLFLLIEKIKGSPVDVKFENLCHMIGFVLLILLSLYVAFNDILRLL